MSATVTSSTVKPDIGPSRVSVQACMQLGWIIQPWLVVETPELSNQNATSALYEDKTLPLKEQTLSLK